MKLRPFAAGLLVPLMLLATMGAGPAGAAPQPPRQIRVATFDVALSRPTPGALVSDLVTGNDVQAATIAETLQTNRPDIVVLNGFDHVADGSALTAFRQHYLEIPQKGQAPLLYPYAYLAQVNSGAPTMHDLDRNARAGGPEDVQGPGAFPGQGGMVVLSKHPIDTGQVRTFQNFLWKDMPGALLPDDPATDTPADWYSDAALASLRLSSTSHWDVPVLVGQQRIHVLVANPITPGGDGPERRNANRNHDEIRFWADYVTPGAGGYIYDDAHVRGGLDPAEAFIIMGNLNADPKDGEALPGAVGQVLTNKRLVDPLPASDGGAEAAARQGKANTQHRGDPAYDTADLADTPGPGNLRTDYVLPSRDGLLFTQAGVFWPVSTHMLFRLTGDAPFPGSAHRLVWVDLRAG